MSDYNIRPKPKVWAGSPNVRPNVVCCSEKTYFTGEWTERPGNVVVSKHVSTHTSS